MKELKKEDRSRENEILLKLSKTLISVSPASRRKGLSIISKYISKNNESISKLQIIKLWKGLYYCMWLSDKVLIQREVAIGISNLQKKFTCINSWLSFIEEFYIMMRFRWDSIDHYRMDKFAFLQRTMISESLDLIKNKDFENSYIEGFFSVLIGTLFVEDFKSNILDVNKIGDSWDFQNGDLINCNKPAVNQFTGIGISLIFCKQFSQEYTYLIYELYKSKRNNDSILLLFKNYSNFVVKLLTSNINHQTLNDYIKNYLIFGLFNTESLLIDIFKDIEELNIEESELNIINDFIKGIVIEQMKIIQSEISEISKCRCPSINQVKRNRLYNVLEKVEEFLENNKKEEFNRNLPKISKNKMRNIKYKQECDHNNQTKKVRFDMSKNTRMLLPDSISTSKALVKMFDKKKLKNNNEINCILFRSTSDGDLLESWNSNKITSEGSNNFDRLDNIEIISAEKALSKPSNTNNSPSKGILRKSENL
ncbi:RRp1-like protein [Cryptosporidium ryanae]|uniref:RRp1-like protein n=1 Tax=Cryptosporidium ryanae TaxID=515981 RepID=UPI00351A78E1|nr:RRp1-like protein [Cryptosporidium ryanae]